jgi:hypothetical protein
MSGGPHATVKDLHGAAVWSRVRLVDPTDVPSKSIDDHLSFGQVLGAQERDFLCAAERKGRHEYPSATVQHCCHVTYERIYRMPSRYWARHPCISGFEDEQVGAHSRLGYLDASNGTLAWP